MAGAALVIAGTHSGVGKTTITLGILRALLRRGLRVQPFKVGPDFIDTGLHTRLSGLISRNLDSWMLPHPFLKECFALHAQQADLALVEGVMGLFDGRRGRGEEGSTAEVAKLISAPVVLVADGSSLARSAGALLMGYARFDPELKLSGVVFNRVGGSTHRSYLREAVEELGERLVAEGLPPPEFLGALPRDPSLELPERHLGLITQEEAPLTESFLKRLADAAEEHIDLEGLLRVAERARPCKPPVPSFLEGLKKRAIGKVRLGVARDKAFCFYYQDNLDILEALGAELVPFSPMADSALPPELDGLYLGGGYPEVHAESLSANLPMRRAVGEFCEGGKPVYAECGGFMYLTKAIVDFEGREYPMVGVFPTLARMLRQRLSLGYLTVELTSPCIFGMEGTRARGHEFHYSAADEPPPEVKRVYRLLRGGETRLEGYSRKGVLASYLHLHFGSNPDFPREFLKRCLEGGRG